MVSEGILLETLKETEKHFKTNSGPRVIKDFLFENIYRK